MCVSSLGVLHRPLIALCSCVCRLSECGTGLIALCSCVCRLSLSAEQATASGAKEQDATNALEKKFKSPPERPLDAAETIRLAITTMQGVLSSDFKATEIEISVVRRAQISTANAPITAAKNA